MRRLPRPGGILAPALLAAALAAAPASAQVPPRQVDVRLLTPVSTTAADPNRAIAAITSDLPPDTLECGPRALEVPADPAVVAMVPSWPVQAESGNPPRGSDWINLAFVGTAAAVERAFAAAGWLTAAQNSLRSDVRTFVAVARRQGYQTGPVSRLTVNGVPPAMVFQKQTNTFAKRHHIRIWSSPFAVDGRPVWVAAATHDVGITFSKATRHFTHRIDGAIDAERAKVMGDLAFAGAVDLYAMVERPAIPLEIHRADGAWVTTDGEIAVVVLREP